MINYKENYMIFFLVEIFARKESETETIGKNIN